MTIADVIIVGGGITGIMAANTLSSLGINNCLILEKSKSVGGRLATRRIEDGIADHGAQYFTAYTDLFRIHTLSWQNQGLIKKWFGGKHPRFTSINGMNSIAKNLAADLDVKLNTKVETIIKENQVYKLMTNQGEFQAKALIITTPAPQTIELVEASSLTVEPKALNKLRMIEFVPCLVALLQLDQPSNLVSLGYVDSKLPKGMERIIDNDKKGISTSPILSIYMTAKWSNDHYHKNDDEIVAMILEEVPADLLEGATVVSCQLKRWRYAEAVKVIHEPFLNGATSSLPLLFAGDAFICKTDPSKRGRLESGVISGILVGQEMKRQIAP
ncbi:NAD(P)/FAD-dependent oxidoreductase [Anaerobacillus isosaccharinicus]|uniref:FAD-dependent oxidoreductase n=1 Tax=Anaerobacillus isosaccharinicus TaxID=1532552 RepID=A0A1S2KTR1_9BACI|nr:FAD-dependent oxidoreductase [Anaerobacillus isosaccharinicus]MBA5588088.1 FAD-dependent oxidoreductase [Anaerobacillus isosaccharinicus]QOY33774.1 FAD-dependent oxidoreductase [Anaerobacillus isosaccharinicus]